MIGASGRWPGFLPAAIVNGIAAAPFLIVVMIISRNRPLTGENRNAGLAAVLGWVTVRQASLHFLN